MCDQPFANYSNSLNFVHLNNSQNQSLTSYTKFTVLQNICFPVHSILWLSVKNYFIELLNLVDSETLIHKHHQYIKKQTESSHIQPPSVTLNPQQK